MPDNSMSVCSGAPGKQAGVGLNECVGPPFVRIDARLVLPAGLERLQARRCHSTFLDEHRGASDVDGAPDTARLTGREPDRVAGVVRTLAPDQLVTAPGNRWEPLEVVEGNGKSFR